MNEKWAEMVELRIGNPMFTPNNDKLYPVCLYRQDCKTQQKYVTPEAASGIGASLVDIFIHVDETNA